MSLGPLVVCLLALLSPLQRQEDLERWLRDLDAAAEPESKRALEALTALGERETERVVERALRDFEQLGFAARRARAGLLGELPTPEHCARVIELARGDPDPGVRRVLAGLLGDPALAEACAAERVRLLAGFLLEDPNAHVRSGARDALRQSGLTQAVLALERALDELPADEAARAAAAFAQQPAARERLVARVLRAFANEGGQPASVGVMGALLRNYGRALAEVPLGGDELAERLPFLLGRRDPSPEIATAARVALAAFVSRAAELSEVERAERVLTRLGEEGWPRVDCLRRRIDLAWAQRGDAGLALELARRLAVESQALGPEQARVWEVHARILEGAALFALDESEEARALFRALARRLNDSRAVREDRFPVPLRPDAGRPRKIDWRPAGGAAYGNRLLLGSTVHVWLALLELRGGARQGTVLEALRVAHRMFLEARLAAMRTGAPDPGTLDAVLDGVLAPMTLVLANEKLGPERREAFLDLALALGAAWGRVAPLEMPGFEGEPPLRRELGEMLLDPERLGCLLAMRSAQLEDIQRRLRGDDRLPQEQEARAQLVNMLRYQERELRRAMREEEEALRLAEEQGQLSSAQLRSIRAQLLDYLTPSLHAHTLAGELRSEGRTAQAQALCQGALRTLARAPLGSTIWVEYQSARLEMLLGSIRMDAGHSREAEESYRDCERRLKSIETNVREWRDSAGSPDAERQAAAQLKRVRELRGEAWLSLAVNANVRQGDSARALEYFEKAYELNRNTFMQVLRACYRARSGKDAEARTVLRSVVPTPVLYYNIACTHALLGDLDEALDYLERDLRENHPTAGARTQKLDWMRGDPDLRNLRAHPRFERLLEGGR